MKSLPLFVSFCENRAPDINQLQNNSNAMSWYNKLSIHQKINFKNCFLLACGVGFQELNFMFNIQERITILHTKLQAEGII